MDELCHDTSNCIVTWAKDKSRRYGGGAQGRWALGTQVEVCRGAATRPPGLATRPGARPRHGAEGCHDTARARGLCEQARLCLCTLCTL